MFRNLIPRGFKKYGLSTNADGFENQKVLIEKIPDYQMILANDKLSKEYTFMIMAMTLKAMMMRRWITLRIKVAKNMLIPK